jgi:hypothetical protein
MTREKGSAWKGGLILTGTPRQVLRASAKRHSISIAQCATAAAALEVNPGVISAVRASIASAWHGLWCLPLHIGRTRGLLPLPLPLLPPPPPPPLLSSSCCRRRRAALRSLFRATAGHGPVGICRSKPKGGRPADLRLAHPCVTSVPRGMEEPTTSSQSELCVAAGRRARRQ